MSFVVHDMATVRHLSYQIHTLHEIQLIEAILNYLPI